MILTYVIIGMMCNSQSCYWVKVENVKFTSLQACMQEAKNIKTNSIMYFETACMVDKE